MVGKMHKMIKQLQTAFTWNQIFLKLKKLSENCNVNGPYGILQKKYAALRSSWICVQVAKIRLKKSFICDSYPLIPLTLFENNISRK